MRIVSDIAKIVFETAKSGKFWLGFAVELVFVLAVKVYFDGKDAYTKKFTFTTGWGSLQEMFGGGLSLLAIVLCLVIIIAAVAGLHWLAKKNYNMQAALVAVAGMIVTGFVGLRWIELDLIVLLEFVIGLLVIFTVTLLIFGLGRSSNKN